MASTRGRSKAVIVTKQSVNQAGVFLQELPEKPKENLSLREAVGQLRDQIQAALAKGYSYDDLSKMLTEKGIEISATTLKSYVPAGKRQSSKDKDKAASGKTRGRRSRKELSEELDEATTLISSQEADEETDGNESSELEDEAAESKPKRGRRAATASSEKGTRGKRAASSTTTRSTRGRQKRS